MAAKTEARGRYVGLGALYILVGFVFCILIREYESLSAAVVFLLMVWAADIGAFFIGKAIGGPKMSPVISPNKTWAGLGGAAIFGGAVGAVYVFSLALLGPEPHIEISPLLSIFCIGFVIGLSWSGWRSGCFSDEAYSRGEGYGGFNTRSWRFAGPD